jgi:hypothetical protein
MSSTIPPWLADVRLCDLRADDLRQAQAELADERARIIAQAVADHGRGGRDWAAAQLGVTVIQVDTAIKRARTSTRPTGLPHDLLDRLYALELAEVSPLPAHLWHSLAQILMGTLVDVTWIEQPGRLVALDVEDSAGEEVDEADAKRLADAARSWTRIQALAVIDAVGRQDLDALPTVREPVAS